MTGRHEGGQERLFYSFNLEEHVPHKHLLRSIDRCFDLGELRQHLAQYYSPIGRPSIDPELMIRMLIVGYCCGIRSERRLCEEVHLNLAYRWFCRLGLEDALPEHSTFSKNRHGRFRLSEAFRWVFDEVVRRCIAAGLVKGEGFAVDASIVAAVQRPRVLRLFDELPDRHRPRCHPRRGSDACESHGASRIHPAHGRARRGALRFHA